MDFTRKRYAQLLDALLGQGYVFYTFEQYCEADKQSLPERMVILRHDIDLRAPYALEIAKIEHERKIKATYYFRVIPQSNQPDIIRAIAEMGHEIGYHYEDMSLCNGDSEKAVAHFQQQLGYFRQFYPVRTVCMHGAPRSNYDSKDIWKYADYKEWGIIGEPYFDVDYADVFYLTDTGRCWDGYKVSRRDKIPQFHDEWCNRGWNYHSTKEVIGAIQQGTIAPRMLITTHPQRWTDGFGAWLWELVFQSLKNVVKRLI